MGKGNQRLISGSLCGLILCLISSLFISLGTLMVSYMKDYDPIAKSFWRFLFTFLPSIFVLIYYVWQDSDVFRVLWPFWDRKGLMIHVSLILRSFFGCTAATLQYYSLKYMPLGDSSVICNSYPVFVAILARVFLGEPFGIFMLISTLVTLSGVVVVTQPPFLTGVELNESQFIGACLAFACSFGMAFAIVMIRHLKKIHHSITLIAFGGYGTIESFLLTLWLGTLEFPEINIKNIELYMAVGVGIFSCVGQMFLIFALKCDNAGPVSLVKTSDVLYAFIWQTIFFQHIPSKYSVIGAVIMMSGLAMAGVQKYVSSLSEFNPKRQKLWFVLR